MKPIPVAYTWDEGPRRFRDHFGRFVKRTEVRKGLDRYVDKLQEEAGNLTVRLQEGEISLERWQRGMADMIKRGHTAATMIARGGREQVRRADWGRTGVILKRQYQYLQGFANELEAGLPITGRVINRAKMYAVAPTATYENMLRQDDIAAGFDVERRILHSVNPCKSCVRYRDMGWQRAGKLPGIGQRCQCKSRCRCTFERHRSSQKRVVAPVKPKPIPKPIPIPVPPEPSKPPATFDELRKRVQGKKLEESWKAASDYIKELEEPGDYPTMIHGMAHAEVLKRLTWNGSVWYYPSSEPRSAIARTFAEIGRHPEELPENLSRHTRQVVFSVQANKNDAYWKVQYNNPHHVSIATGGDGSIVVYRGDKIDRGNLTHEMGHNLAMAKYGSTMPPALSDFGKAATSGEKPTSDYGRNSRDEDFAESVQDYLKFNHSNMLSSHPRRAEVIGRLMREADYGG